MREWLKSQLRRSFALPVGLFAFVLVGDGG